MFEGHGSLTIIYSERYDAHVCFGDTMPVRFELVLHAQVWGESFTNISGNSYWWLGCEDMYRLGLLALTWKEYSTETIVCCILRMCMQVIPS